MTEHEMRVVVFVLGCMVALVGLGGMLSCRDHATLKRRQDEQADEIRRLKGHGDRLALLELTADRHLLPSNPTVDMLYPLGGTPQTEWDEK